MNKFVLVVDTNKFSRKEIIQGYSADFDGSLEDQAVIKLAGISRNTYYKYKKQIRADYSPS